MNSIDGRGLTVAAAASAAARYRTDLAETIGFKQCNRVDASVGDRRRHVRQHGRRT